MKIIERIFDASTGETTDIERDMSAAELANYEAAQQRAEAQAKIDAEAEAKRSAALAKLEALGLDEDDLQALGL